jgi:hypothetical protein
LGPGREGPARGARRSEVVNEAHDRAELDRSPGLLLPDGRTIDRITNRSDVFDPQIGDVATISLQVVHILKQCGDDLTRANIMKQATDIKGFVADLALPGMTNSTTPDDWRINKQF